MDIRVTMPAALRHHVDSEEQLWARFVSLLFSPPVVWAIWITLVAMQYASDQREALIFAAPFVLTICALPMLFVACMVKIGRIGDMHMRRSSERYIPYSIAILGCLFTETLYLQLGAHPVLIIAALVCLIELTIMLIGTFFVHISLHAMAMTSVISAATIMHSFQQSLIFLPMLLLVILARLTLKRHTAMQIGLGALIGALTPMAVIAALSLLA